MKIKEGQMLAITSGVYSDYTLVDHVRALRDFDTKNEIAEFVKTGNYFDPEVGVHDSDSRFVAWAIRDGLIAPLSENEVIEWHIGEYQELDVGESE